MSTHEVKVVKIENLRPHTNADSLELTDVWGYQCVLRKGTHQIGDLMAYVEPDYTVLLSRDEFKFLDKGKGKERHRVTVIKLRGERSYGLLIPAPEGSKEGDNVIDLLQVGRYEPPQRGAGFGPTGFLSGLCDKGPEFHAPHYDLENLRKFNKVIEDGEEVIYTEKVHGTNARYVFSEDKFHCGSRTTWKKKPSEFNKSVEYTDKEIGEVTTKELFTPENTWHKAAEQNPWIEEWCRANPNVVLYGEVYGPHVQGAHFKYGKQDGEYGFAVFDILKNGKWVDNKELFDNPEYANTLGETVKVVYRGKHNKEMLFKMIEEKSVYPNQPIREGIVVKPLAERTEPRIGRVALKAVSDRYLMKEIPEPEVTIPFCESCGQMIEE